MSMKIIELILSNKDIWVLLIKLGSGDDVLPNDIKPLPQQVENKKNSREHITQCIFCVNALDIKHKKGV